MNVIDFNRMILTQCLHMTYSLEFIVSLGLKVGSIVHVHTDVYSQPILFVFHHVTNDALAVFYTMQSLN